MMRDILQAIVNLEWCTSCQLYAESGYALATCVTAASFLRKYGLVTDTFKGQHNERYSATEKGKIVCAILKGQESRKAHNRLKAPKYEYDAREYPL